MATVQISPSQTGASTVNLETANYPRVMIMAAGLAGAETVTISVLAPGEVAVPVVNDDNVAAVLTVALPSVILAGSPTYQIAKSATAGASSLSFSPMTHPGS